MTKETQTSANDAIITEIEKETDKLNMETSAAAILAMQAAISHLCEITGVNINDIKIEEHNKERHSALVKSIAQRLMRIATYSAQLRGSDMDQQATAERLLKMLQNSGDTTDTDDVLETIFGGGVDKVKEEPAKPTSRDDMTDATGYALDSFVKKPEPEAVEDNKDLMGVFRSARAAKAESGKFTFEDGVFTGNFYNPETLPEDPEEFADYDRRAIDYFKSMVSQAEKQKLIDNNLANQIVVVLHGGVNFQQDEVVGDGTLTKKIVSQGHDHSQFSVEAKEPRAVSEAIIAAYSVSVARLRGAYVQAKLGELAAYMEENGQSGPKF